MNESEQLLADYRQGSHDFIKLLHSINTHSFDYFPNYKDSWSIKEHVIHVIDSEINGFVRLKSIIAQPSSNCYVMNEEDWTKNIRRKNEDLKKYLDIFKLIRELAYEFIYDEDETKWEDQYFVRTYKGNEVKITIKEWLKTYNNHLKYHIEYIEKIVDEIKRKKNL